MRNLKWQRAGALSAAVFVTMSACQPLNIAQAQSRPQTKIRGCNAESLLLPTHPDVETLRQLHERYTGKTPVEIELGMSRLEFAQTLAQLVRSLDRLQNSEQATRLSSADASLLKQLQQDYAAELVRLRDGLRPAFGHRPSSKNRQRLPGRQQGTTTFSNGPVAPAPRPLTESPSLSSDEAETAKPQLVAPPTPLAQPPSEPTFQDRDRIHVPGTFNTEDYKRINENPFFLPQRTPLSTFSIDVDTASYSNVRRFLRQGQLPPKDAVRLEELINYFDYDYTAPQGDQPFSVSTEVATTPWNSQHKLVHIGLKGKELQQEQPSNLVFLIDVSGSMQRPNKLALVKKSLCLLVDQLKPQDRVSLVVYAGQAGIVLPPTPGTQKTTIMDAIDRLEAGGTTAGGGRHQACL